MEFLEFFLPIFQNSWREWLKKAETEDLVNGLDELAQNHDVIAAVIFTLIDVKDESRLKQQQPCYFCYNHFLDSGTSQHHCLVLLHGMLCFFQKIYFQQLKFIFKLQHGFESYMI